MIKPDRVFTMADDSPAIDVAPCDCFDGGKKLSGIGHTPLNLAPVLMFNWVSKIDRFQVR